MSTFLSLTALPAVFAAAPVAVAQPVGSGVLMFLQGLACVIVSVAALAYIIRAIRCERRELAREQKTVASATLEAAVATPAAAVATPAPAASAAPVAAATHAPATAAVTEDNRLGAVVAAAVHTMMQGRPHRIVRIYETGHGWAQEGRREIFSSKRVR